MTRRGRLPGFTLVELLISMVLMMIILAAVGMVFSTSVEVTNLGEARIRVYENARRAMDRLQTDLLGAVSFDGRQSLILENGVSNPSTGAISYTGSSAWADHVRQGADKIQFRSVTVGGDLTQQLLVTYVLEPSGDPTRSRGKSTRYIYVLKRYLQAPNPSDPGVFDVRPQDSSGATLEEPDTMDGNPATSEELVHYVTSFNVEYYGNDGRFSQLHPSPCPPTEPLGDGKSANDGMTWDAAQGKWIPWNELVPPGTPGVRIPYLRVTLTVLDDVGERQERTITRVFWVPTGT